MYTQGFHTWPVQIEKRQSNGEETEKWAGKCGEAQGKKV